MSVSDPSSSGAADVPQRPGVRAVVRLARRRGPARAAPLLTLRAARAGVLRMRRAVEQVVNGSSHSLFLRALVAQPARVGAICASSPQLAARMAAWVDPDAPGLVVELGGGTGVITAALLARGVAPQRLVVIEQSPVLARHLAQRFPQVRVVQGDAAELALLQRAPDWPRGDDGAPRPVHCIVSGLPLLSIPPQLRQRILQAGAQTLAPGGRLLQFTYALRGPSPWQVTGLSGCARERVLANLPPARIDVLTRLDGG
ncbi:MAG TPA: methyltransferase domain-containing protein [Ottowia sp.]|nr:methyltransferase domain-containing protein [Ottowia sp.]HQQ54359.1 methyltransferase domain-containing protein [Ottowia sp.]